MVESDTLRNHRKALDRTISGVMPQSWNGHARLAIRRSSDIPEHIEEKAISKAVKLAEEKDASPETVANKLIRKMAEKRSE